MVVAAKNVLKSAGKKTVHLIGNCIKVSRNDTAKIINFISCDGSFTLFYVSNCFMYDDFTSSAMSMYGFIAL